MTCSNSEVFLMRISLQMRSWRNWTAPSRTISSRAREGGCYQPSRRRVIENDCERDQVVFDQQPLAQVPCVSPRPRRSCRIERKTLFFTKPARRVQEKDSYGRGFLGNRL
jgi:hypothetical protein